MSARSGLSREQTVREEHSAGGVVLRRIDGRFHALLIRDPYGNWGLPKGHLERGETFEEAGLREVGEETGLDRLELGPELRTIDWFFRLKGRLIHKHCTFFLMASRSGTPVPEAQEGITECRWVPLLEAVETIAYENAREVLRDAARLVLSEEGPLPVRI
jgi:ADP-ribose pyrophosphatase YjhB (NUDIX family)